MKKLDCSKRQLTTQLLCAAILIFLLPSAYATLTMTFNGAPGSPTINVSFSGRSTVGLAGGSRINFGWDFVPTDFDPFPQQITGDNYGQFNFTSGAAQFMNVTRSETSTLTGVWLQDSSNSPIPGWERFGMLNPTIINYTPGDTYEWSGSATIDLSARGLTFDSLHPGATGPIFGLAPETSGVLEGQLLIVPEPSSCLLLSAAALAGVLRHAVRRRKTLVA